MKRSERKSAKTCGEWRSQESHCPQLPLCAVSYRYQRCTVTCNKYIRQCRMKWTFVNCVPAIYGKKWRALRFFFHALNIRTLAHLFVDSINFLSFEVSTFIWTDNCTDSLKQKSSTFKFEAHSNSYGIGSTDSARLPQPKVRAAYLTFQIVHFRTINCIYRQANLPLMMDKFWELSASSLANVLGANWKWQSTCVHDRCTTLSKSSLFWR